MKIKINPQTDPYLHFIDGWQIFRTISEDRSYYIIKDGKLILILGFHQNISFGMALKSNALRINHDVIDGIDLLSVIMPHDDLLILTNADVHDELARILPAHSGGMSILSPTVIYQSGYQSIPINDPHPSGKSFDVFTLDEFETSGGKIYR